MPKLQLLNVSVGPQAGRTVSRQNVYNVADISMPKYKAFTVTQVYAARFYGGARFLRSGAAHNTATT